MKHIVVWPSCCLPLSSPQRYQKVLDDLVPYKIPRWGVSVGLMVLYAVRVMLLQGWYIITYALAIYLLNLLIAFLSPKFDPALQEETEIGMFEE